MQDESNGSPQYHPPFVPEPQRKPSYMLVGIIVVLTIALAIVGYLVYVKYSTNGQNDSAASPSPSPSAAPAASDRLTLDPAKDYGDKYVDGIFPVGDGKYSTQKAEKGSVYACSNYAQSLTTAAGGANTRGPWFVGTDKYDLDKKDHVGGTVNWQGNFSNVATDEARIITTNNLPLKHPTGTFPIPASDTAYRYDRNPNAIKAQSYIFNLEAAPNYGTPKCIGGEVGIMLTGVKLFNAFDAAGRDAGAWEIQDSCSGHPERQGAYHYHTLSSCIDDTGVGTIIGYALDGFPITGPKVAEGNILTTSDLDECHGITSEVFIDGKRKTTYHYVMTQDFPYSVSCFRGTPIQPPGLQAAPRN